MLIIQYQVSERIALCLFIWPPGDKFMLIILPPGVKLIIQYQVSERIAYAPIFGLRAVSLSGEKLIIQDQMSERIAYVLYLAFGR